MASYFRCCFHRCPWLHLTLCTQTCSETHSRWSRYYGVSLLSELCLDCEPASSCQYGWNRNRDYRRRGRRNCRHGSRCPCWKRVGSCRYDHRSCRGRNPESPLGCHFRRSARCSGWQADRPKRDRIVPLSQVSSAVQGVKEHAASAGLKSCRGSKLLIVFIVICFLLRLRTEICQKLNMGVAGSFAYAYGDLIFFPQKICRFYIICINR